MAKKTSGGKKKSKTRFNAKKKGGAGKPKRPQAQRLSGMEDMPKDRMLDTLCKTIKEALVNIVESRESETAARANAMARMVRNNTTIYRAHGVELIFKKGVDKLQVKQIDSDEGGDAGEDPADTDVDAGAETEPSEE